MKGFFNIQRGINECGIESSVIFANPLTLGGKPVPKIRPPPPTAFTSPRQARTVVKTDDGHGHPLLLPLLLLGTATGRGTANCNINANFS